MIRTRKLGQLEVGAQGLGCMGMSDFYTTGFDEAASIKVIHRALELGVTLLDTADMYGPFENEKLVGRALVGKRHQAVVATKFSVVRGEDGSWKGLRGDAAYVKQACEASLKRLGLDCIDLYYQHRVDPDTPIEETRSAPWPGSWPRARSGTWACPRPPPSTIRRAHAVHPITALQTEWSIWSRDLESAALPVARELGVGIVPYSPLGRGFLTGSFASRDDIPDGDYRKHNPRFADGAFERNLAVAEAVKSIAAELDATPAQVALAWVQQQGDDVVPIPGTKRLKYLEDNVGALEVSLSQAHMAHLDRLAAHVAGDRYADMSGVGR